MILSHNSFCLKPLKYQLDLNVTSHICIIQENNFLHLILSVSFGIISSGFLLLMSSCVNLLFERGSFALSNWILKFLKVNDMILVTLTLFSLTDNSFD